MGWTVLYIAFGVVALWLLGEVLLQYKARLRWRLTAFFGFLTVVVGVLLPSVPVIALGTVAFAVGQTFVTLSFRKGFDHGWALETSRRRVRGGGGTGRADGGADDAAPGPAAAAPALEVSALEETAAYAVEPLPDDTGPYGVHARDADGAHGPGHRPEQADAYAPHAAHGAGDATGDGLYQDPYLGGTGTPDEREQHQYAEGPAGAPGYGDDAYGATYPGDSGASYDLLDPPGGPGPYTAYTGYDGYAGYSGYQDPGPGAQGDGGGQGGDLYGPGPGPGQGSGTAPYGYGYSGGHDAYGAYDAYGYPAPGPDGYGPGQGQGQGQEQDQPPADGVWVPQQRESDPAQEPPYSYQDGYRYPAPDQRNH
ncbi:MULTISPECIES: hypothetical protein [Streptomyces]|uniref:hypothetical protein n=1 Tax=Streptomyces TaxID=1883 RepID=UPI002248A338|nr:hypothetical protein [Streptomyces sp. JHD 1]MCX2967626.1 hypothetical protein [Streptomyces sp. JHD 1]